MLSQAGSLPWSFLLSQHPEEMLSKLTFLRIWLLPFIGSGWWTFQTSSSQAASTSWEKRTQALGLCSSCLLYEERISQAHRSKRWNVANFQKLFKKLCLQILLPTYLNLAAILLRLGSGQLTSGEQETKLKQCLERRSLGGFLSDSVVCTRSPCSVS